MKLKHLLLYVWVSIALFLLQKIFTDQFNFDQLKVQYMSAFLLGVYVLFYFLFFYIRRKRKDQSAFIFTGLIILKLLLVFSFILWEINPIKTENKEEVLLFIVNYFALLITDIPIKAKVMNS